MSTGKKKRISKWGFEEDRQLLRCVKKYGQNRWNLVARWVGTRSVKQCQLRWAHILAYLGPQVLNYVHVIESDGEEEQQQPAPPSASTPSTSAASTSLTPPHVTIHSPTVRSQNKNKRKTVESDSPQATPTRKLPLKRIRPETTPTTKPAASHSAEPTPPSPPPTTVLTVTSSTPPPHLPEADPTPPQFSSIWQHPYYIQVLETMILDFADPNSPVNQLKHSIALHALRLPTSWPDQDLLQCWSTTTPALDPQILRSLRDDVAPYKSEASSVSLPSSSLHQRAGMDQAVSAAHSNIEFRQNPQTTLSDPPLPLFPLAPEELFNSTFAVPFQADDPFVTPALPDSATTISQAWDIHSIVPGFDFGTHTLQPSMESSYFPLQISFDGSEATDPETAQPGLPDVNASLEGSGRNEDDPFQTSPGAPAGSLAIEAEEDNDDSYSDENISDDEEEDGDNDDEDLGDSGSDAQSELEFEDDEEDNDNTIDYEYPSGRKEDFSAQPLLLATETRVSPPFSQPFSPARLKPSHPTQRPRLTPLRPLPSSKPIVSDERTLPSSPTVTGIPHFPAPRALIWQDSDDPDTKVYADFLRSLQNDSPMSFAVPESAYSAGPNPDGGFTASMVIDSIPHQYSASEANSEARNTTVAVDEASSTTTAGSFNLAVSTPSAAFGKPWRLDAPSLAPSHAIFPEDLSDDEEYDDNPLGPRIESQEELRQDFACRISRQEYDGLYRDGMANADPLAFPNGDSEKSDSASLFSAEQMVTLRRQMQANLQIVAQALVLETVTQGQTTEVARHWQGQLDSLLEYDSYALETGVDDRNSFYRIIGAPQIAAYTHYLLYHVLEVPQPTTTTTTDLPPRFTIADPLRSAIVSLPSLDTSDVPQFQRDFRKPKWRKTKVKESDDVVSGTTWELANITPMSLPACVDDYLTACRPIFHPDLLPRIVSSRYRSRVTFFNSEDNLLLFGLRFFGQDDKNSIRSHLLPTKSNRQIENRIGNLKARRVKSNPVKSFLLLQIKPFTLEEGEILRSAVGVYGKRFRTVNRKIIKHRPSFALRSAWASLSNRQPHRKRAPGTKATSVLSQITSGIEPLPELAPTSTPRSIPTYPSLAPATSIQPGPPKPAPSTLTVQNRHLLVVRARARDRNLFRKRLGGIYFASLLCLDEILTCCSPFFGQLYYL
ncbi:hypothetical protein BJ085DRAFT_28494 [Dimargaris cristalligena]|uniref:Myb-like domain-containing protein n=1 Tax=Dimargaris cristalligena TaxID=215637 RepID=A0A4P9ZQ43_9FUNG|nr:hypothetical protein BJ085DRAFT_28494 [Dimargaris cristalligena]|eukprot:RKP35318.1 hypothetical protein BJ085DRAFT_28494 [Dimargaris cristalligena]